MISRRADANDKCAKIVTTISFNFRENISFCLCRKNNPFLQPGSPGQKWMKAIMVHNWWLQTDNKPFFLKRLFHLLVSEKRDVIELKMYIRRFWKGVREFIALFYLLRIFNFIVYILGICKEKTTINKKNEGTS